MSAKFTKARALVIGISEYALVDPLPDKVRRDAVDIANAFRSQDIAGYDPKHVQLLTNQEATKGRITGELVRAADSMTEDELFLFYFSGHGARVRSVGSDHNYVATYDTDLNNLDNTALRDDEFLDLLKAFPAKRQVVILDACHSGGVGAIKGVGNASQTRCADGFDALGRGRGRVLLCSCRPEEVSLALPTMNNSVFTAVLLDGLRGGANDRGDGTIGVFDLFSYIAAEVPKLANQHPIFKADSLEENFAIAVRPTSRSIHAQPKTLALSTDQQIEAVLCALYPLGPMHNNFWQRAGGDASRLEASGNGAAQWHSALRLVQLGGGGISIINILDAALSDYASNATLAALRSGAEP
jgi:metacaspase-1